MKKTFSLAIVCLMILSLVLSACGTTAPASSSAAPSAPAAPASSSASVNPADVAPPADDGSWTSPGGIKYPLEGKPKLTWYYELAANNYIKDETENTAFIQAMEATGVELEFRHPVVGQEVQTLNLMMASGDLTDMIYRTDVRYEPGFDFGLQEGLFIDHDELLKAYAPDYMAIVNSEDDLKRQVATDQGKIRGFAMMTVDSEGFDMLPLRIELPASGPAIRKDILDKLGLDVPKTIADWDKALRAMKADGVEIPLMIWNVTDTIDKDVGTFITAYGIAPEFYIKDGKVLYGPAQDEMKNYLELMRSWYADGLIDREWPTRKAADAEALIFNAANTKNVGAYTRYTTAYPLQAHNMGLEMVGTPIPVLNDISEINWRQNNNLSRGYITTITSACKTPEAAAMFLNYGYTDPGYKLYNYGIDGVNYDGFDANGIPQYIGVFKTEWDARRESFRLHNGSYLKSDYRCNPRSTALDGTLYQYRQEWGKPSNDYVLPPFSMTADEGKESASIMADIVTLREEMFTKFIIGSIPMSDFENVFQPAVESMNLARACEIREDAVARYWAREIN